MVSLTSFLQSAANLPLHVSHTPAALLCLPSAGVVLRCPAETSPPGSINEDKHQCQAVLCSPFSSDPLSAALPCFLHLSPSSHLDVSPALLLSELVRGVYTSAGLRTWVTASLHVCMGACVCGCVSVDMCMCRMKCRLPPIYASHKQTHLHSRRGWLLCKK